MPSSYKFLIPLNLPSNTSTFLPCLVPDSGQQLLVHKITTSNPHHVQLNICAQSESHSLFATRVIQCQPYQDQCLFVLLDAYSPLPQLPLASQQQFLQAFIEVTRLFKSYIQNYPSTQSNEQPVQKPIFLTHSHIFVKNIQAEMQLSLYLWGNSDEYPIYHSPDSSTSDHSSEDEQVWRLGILLFFSLFSPPVFDFTTMSFEEAYRIVLSHLQDQSRRGRNTNTPIVADLATLIKNMVKMRASDRISLKMLQHSLAILGQKIKKNKNTPLILHDQDTIGFRESQNWNHYAQSLKAGKRNDQFQGWKAVQNISAVQKLKTSASFKNSHSYFGIPRSVLEKQNHSTSLKDADCNRLGASSINNPKSPASSSESFYNRRSPSNPHILTNKSILAYMSHSIYNKSWYQNDTSGTESIKNWTTNKYAPAHHKISYRKEDQTTQYKELYQKYCKQQKFAKILNRTISQKSANTSHEPKSGKAQNQSIQNQVSHKPTIILKSRLNSSRRSNSGRSVQSSSQKRSLEKGQNSILVKQISQQLSSQKRKPQINYSAGSDQVAKKPIQSNSLSQKRALRQKPSSSKRSDSKQELQQINLEGTSKNSVKPISTAAPSESISKSLKNLTGQFATSQTKTDLSKKEKPKLVPNTNEEGFKEPNKYELMKIYTFLGDSIKTVMTKLKLEKPLWAVPCFLIYKCYYNLRTMLTQQFISEKPEKLALIKQHNDKIGSAVAAMFKSLKLAESPHIHQYPLVLNPDSILPTGFRQIIYPILHQHFVEIAAHVTKNRIVLLQRGQNSYRNMIHYLVLVGICALIIDGKAVRTGRLNVLVMEENLRERIQEDEEGGLSVSVITQQIAYQLNCAIKNYR